MLTIILMLISGYLINKGPLCFWFYPFLAHFSGNLKKPKLFSEINWPSEYLGYITLETGWMVYQLQLRFLPHLRHLLVSLLLIEAIVQDHFRGFSLKPQFLLWSKPALQYHRHNLQVYIEFLIFNEFIIFTRCPEGSTNQAYPEFHEYWCKNLFS